MKTMMTLPELSQEILRVKEAKADFLADTRQLGFYSEDNQRDSIPNVVGLTLDTGNEERGFPLTHLAEGQIAARLQVPKKFWDRLRADHPDILQDTVTKLFTREPEERMVRTLDGNARAFLSNRYRRIDNAEIAEHAIFPVLAEYPDVQIRSAGLTDTRMYLKATFPNVEAEVRVGEILRSGVAISNSEVGAGRFMVELFVEVLECTNGMIGTTSLAKQHTGGRLTSDEDGGIFSDETIRASDLALMMEARDLIRAATDKAAFEAIVASCKELTEIEVGPAPPKAVEKLGERLSLTEGEQESMLKHLISGGDLTAWGYVNAVTRTAEDATSYDRATELERLGGKLTELPAQEWRLN